MISRDSGKIHSGDQVWETWKKLTFSKPRKPHFMMSLNLWDHTFIISPKILNALFSSLNYCQNTKKIFHDVRILKIMSKSLRTVTIPSLFLPSFWALYPHPWNIFSVLKICLMTSEFWEFSSNSSSARSSIHNVTQVSQLFIHILKTF